MCIIILSSSTFFLCAKKTSLDIAISGNTEDIQREIARLPEINLRLDTKGNTFLHYMTWTNNLEAINALLARGANIDAGNDSGETALHFAAFLGNEIIFKNLLKRGANINLATKRVKNTFPSVYLAHYFGRLNSEMVPPKFDVYGFTLGSQQRCGRYDECTYEYKAVSGETVIHYAAANDHLEIIEELFKNGANLSRVAIWTFERKYEPGAANLGEAPEQKETFSLKAEAYSRIAGKFIWALNHGERDGGVVARSSGRRLDLNMFRSEYKKK